MYIPTSDGHPYHFSVPRQDRWKEFEVGKNAILRLEEDSEQVHGGAGTGGTVGRPRAPLKGPRWGHL